MPHLYLDLDGVFADFDGYVESILGAHPSKLDDNSMWAHLKTIPHFYRKLEPMPQFDTLWAHFRPFNPTFLSGVPRPEGEMVTAAENKRWWVSTYLGPEVPLITCLSSQKSRWCSPGDVLLDDRDHYANLWRDRGGVFVHHKPDEVERSIAAVYAALGRSA